MTVDLWKNGKKIGVGECDTIDGALVLNEYTPIILAMKAAAKAEGVNLTLAVGIRTYEKQVAVRKKFMNNEIERLKVKILSPKTSPPDIIKAKERQKKVEELLKDEKYIATAPVTDFYPLAAIPGYSNHGYGKAYDWNVTGLPDAYKWLIKNAVNWSMYRTIKSERWHWQIEKPQINMFAFVPKTDPTWDNLV